MKFLEGLPSTCSGIRVKSRTETKNPQLEMIIRIRPDSRCITRPPVMARMKPPTAMGVNQTAVCSGPVSKTFSRLKVKFVSKQAYRLRAVVLTRNWRKRGRGQIHHSSRTELQ